MLLKLSWYIFKLECFNFRMLNAISMVTTKKITMTHIQQEMRKEFKRFTTKKSNRHKEVSNERNEGQNAVKYTRINNMTEESHYFKYKWTKLYNQQSWQNG